MSSYNTLDPNNVAGLTPAQIAHKQALYDKYRHQEYVSTGVNGAPMNFFGLGDVNPDTLAGAMLLTFGSGIGADALGAGAAESGTSMLSPEAAGGYQSFTAPSSLTGVSAAPEIGSSGLFGSAGVTAGTSPYAITGTAGGSGLTAAPAAAGSLDLAGAGAGLSSMGGGTGLTVGGVGAGGGMSLIDYGKAGLDFLKDNQWAGTLLGGLIGASASGDTKTTASKDPWGPAQPYLLENLKRNAAMQNYYMANPFSAEQQRAYQGVFDANANAQANVGGLLANANAFSQSKGGRMPAMTGLLSGVTAPAVNWDAYKNIGKV